MGKGARIHLSNVHVIDSIGKVYALLSTLCFRSCMRWPIHNTVQSLACLDGYVLVLVTDSCFRSDTAPSISATAQKHYSKQRYCDAMLPN